MKRGMEPVVIVVLFLVTALVLFPIYNEIQKATREQAPVERCRKSVEVLSSLKQSSGLTLDRLMCDRRWEFFKDETPDQVNKKILQDIKDCAYQFGEGKVDFTQGGKVFSDRSCAVCASFEFVPDSNAAKTWYGDAFYQYLRRVPHQEGETFAEFFKKSGSDGKQGLIYDIEQVLVPNEKYLLYFAYTPESVVEHWGKKASILDEDASTLPVIVLEEYPGSVKQVDGKEVLPKFKECQNLLN